MASQSEASTRAGKGRANERGSTPHLDVQDAVACETTFPLVTRSFVTNFLSHVPHARTTGTATAQRRTLVYRIPTDPTLPRRRRSSPARARATRARGRSRRIKKGVMDIDDLLAEVGGDATPQESRDLQELTRAWVAERTAPEILSWPEELMGRVLGRVGRQVRL